MASRMRPGNLELLLLALALVAAHHAVPYWLVMRVLPALDLYRSLGPNGYANFWDALSLLLPLLLCLGAPRESGLRLEDWLTHRWKLFAVCGIPVLATAIVNPFTSQPFAGGRVGSWLVSPAAQDLLFTGYLYGLFRRSFPGRLASRFPVDTSILITAAFFSLWHVPNFMMIHSSFVVFQLGYTFLGGVCFLLARKWSGSVLPGLACHMACNFLAWAGW